jgi:hypothetical protein
LLGFGHPGNGRTKKTGERIETEMAGEPRDRGLPMFPLPRYDRQEGADVGDVPNLGIPRCACHGLGMASNLSVQVPEQVVINAEESVPHNSTRVLRGSRADQ